MVHTDFTEQSGGQFVFAARNAGRKQLTSHYLMPDYRRTLCGVWRAEESLGPDAELYAVVHPCGRCARIRRGYKAAS